MLGFAASILNGGLGSVRPEATWCWSVVNCLATCAPEPAPVRVTRVIGVLEPGGAQLSMLRLARAQSVLGVQTRLVAGDATPQGVALARHYGLEPLVFACHDTVVAARRQWCPDEKFATWLQPLLRDCDLVHGHMFGAWWAAAMAAPPDVPVVASEHNALSWPFGDQTPAAIEAAHRVALFFGHGPVSTAFAAQVGVPSGRVRVGRSAVSFHARPRPGLPVPRITFTGRLREDKGPDLLVRALAEISNPPPTYIVGDGPMSTSLHRMIDRLGLAPVVRMPGWSFEPARYVAGSAVHVVPSREEAWSQSAVTALGLGVPVVATAVEGLPITLGGGRGVLVQPEDPQALADAITAVLDGEIALDQQAGRRYAADFDAARIAADYLTCYQSVVHPDRADNAVTA